MEQHGVLEFSGRSKTEEFPKPGNIVHPVLEDFCIGEGEKIADESPSAKFVLGAAPIIIPGLSPIHEWDDNGDLPRAKPYTGDLSFTWTGLDVKGKEGGTFC